MVSYITYWKKMYLTRAQYMVFSILDKYSFKKVRRYQILYELGWSSKKYGVFTRIINKFIKEGLFQIKYFREKGSLMLEIIPLYTIHKAFPKGSGERVELWVKIRKKV